MYCKNCGRQLKDGMRFCDRCGQSVRKSKQTGQSAKRQEIEELKAERLNRKKRLAEKEAKQVRNKKNKKNKGFGMIFFIAALLIAIVSAIIGYIIMAPNDNGLNTNINPSTTVEPTKSTTTSNPTSSAVTTNEPESKNGYTSVTIGGVTCPYPSTFTLNTTTGNEKLNLKDSLGGASMIVSQVGKSGTPAELMREYASEIGGDLPYTRAGDDWYAVTTNTGDTVHHRKCVLRNGIAVYYDFSYASTSTAAKKYDEYIEYIDNNFK